MTDSNSKPIENTQIIKTLSELRQEIDTAKMNLEEWPGYQNSLYLARAQKEFDDAVKEARETFILLDGDKGFHPLSPLEIAVSALKEIVSRSNATHEQYGYLFTDGLEPFKYAGTVAKQALKDIGE